MYEAYYKLSSDPFRLLPDPSVCYPHRSCAKAWAYLRYALKRGEGIVVVTGPPGSGKTTLAERLLNEINPAKTVSAHLVANDLNATDLLRKLAYSLGLAAEGLDRAMLAFRIERYLIELEHSSRRALVVIDEAQTLSHQSLEAVRLLTDLQSRSRAVMQLVVLGQDELEGVLSAPGMEQFQHRVIARCQLSPMDLEETKAYMEYRLALARWRGDPSINGPAVKAIFEESRGLPRHVNKICSRLLLHGSSEEKHALSDRDVRAVVRDLREESLAPHESPATMERSGSSGAFDSVYELALVPPADSEGTEFGGQPRGFEELSLEEPGMQAESAHRQGVPPSSSVQMVRRTSAFGGGDYFYLRSGRQSRRPWRRVRRLLRSVSGPVRQAVRGVAAGAVHSMRAARHLYHRLLRGSRAWVADGRSWLADEGQERSSWHKAAAQIGMHRAQLGGLAALAIAAFAAYLWFGDDASVATPSEPIVVQSPPPEPVFSDAGELPDGRLVLGEATGFLQAMDGDPRADDAVGAGEHAAAVGVDRHVTDTLLNRLAPAVANDLVSGVSQSRTTLALWTLARHTATIAADGQTLQPDRPEGAGMTGGAGTADAARSSDTGPGDISRADAASAEDDAFSRIAMVFEQRPPFAGYVRTMPAPSDERSSANPDVAAARVAESDGQASVAEQQPADGADVEVYAVNDMQVASLPVAMLDASPRGSQVAGPPVPGAQPVLPSPTEEVDRYLALGKRALAQNRLLLPPEHSAHAYFQRVLDIDADNAAARKGVERIVDRYGNLARDALAEQDFDKANLYVERALRVDADDRATLALRDEIAHTVEELEQARLREAELARMAAEIPEPEPPVEPPKRPQLSAFQRLMGLVNGRELER